MKPLPTDGPIGECACPELHEHGTLLRYRRHRCRCRPCRAAEAALSRERYRQKVYGRWRSMYVDHAGTARRVHALMAIGWDITSQAHMIGMVPSQLIHGVNGSRPIIYATTARKVAKLYDKLWDKPRVGGDKGTRISVAMTTRRAERAGYAPPLLWDDGKIDDPNWWPQSPWPLEHGIDEIAVERLMEGSLRLPKHARVTLELVEAIRRLAHRGFTDAEIGQRVARSKDAVLKIRERNDIPPGSPLNRQGRAA